MELHCRRPELLFAAWSVAPAPGADLRFRLYEARGRLLDEGPAFPEGRHYFRVPAQGIYALALGHRDGGGGFSPLGTSGWVPAVPAGAMESGLEGR